MTILLALGIGCGLPASPTAPATPPPVSVVYPVPDQAAVVDALNYWASAIGIAYVLIDADALPRVLIQQRADLAGSLTLGVTEIRAVDSGNSITTEIIGISPDAGRGINGGTILYRHELGHALGFLAHDNQGLMADSWTNLTATLSDREQRMMLALYSLPPGTRVAADGRWQSADGHSGVLTDTQAALDVIAFNTNSPLLHGSCLAGTTCRWTLPLRVYVLH